MTVPPLSGFLDEITIPDIARLLQSTRRSGRLAISTEGMAGSVYFERGDIIDSHANNSTGLEALKYIAIFRRAAFEFIDGVLAPSRNLGAYPTQELIRIMEIRLQEALQIQELMPSLNDIPRYIGGTIPNGFELNASELSLAMKSVKGTLSVSVLADQLQMDLLLVRYTVARLRAVGLMELFGSESESGAPAAAAPAPAPIALPPPELMERPEPEATTAPESAQPRYWRGRRIG